MCNREPQTISIITMPETELVVFLAERFEHAHPYETLFRYLDSIDTLVTCGLLLPDWKHTSAVLRQLILKNRISEESRKWLLNVSCAERARLLVAMWEGHAKYDDGAFVNTWVRDYKEAQKCSSN